MSQMSITLYDEDGTETEHQLPSKMEVCPRCEGHGTHLTPSIGEHAYSAEEFYESFSEPEDREEYFKRGGIYDVTCYTCKGANVIQVVDEDACLRDEKLKSIFLSWQEQEEESAAFEAECRVEREMEAKMLGEWEY